MKRTNWFWYFFLLSLIHVITLWPQNVKIHMSHPCVTHECSGWLDPYKHVFIQHLFIVVLHGLRDILWFFTFIDIDVKRSTLCLESENNCWIFANSVPSWIHAVLCDIFHYKWSMACNIRFFFRVVSWHESALLSEEAIVLSTHANLKLITPRIDNVNFHNHSLHQSTSLGQGKQWIPHTAAAIKPGSVIDIIV